MAPKIRTIEGKIREKKNRGIVKGRIIFLRRWNQKISTNFINNLYIGVNEASNPLSHQNIYISSPTRHFKLRNT